MIKLDENDNLVVDHAPDIRKFIQKVFEGHYVNYKFITHVSDLSYQEGGEYYAFDVGILCSKDIDTLESVAYEFESEAEKDRQLLIALIDYVL